MSLPGFPDAMPFAGLGGGILIGLAAALMLLGNGRIAGISGIFARAIGLSAGSQPIASAWVFLLGLPVGALAVLAIMGRSEVAFASPVLLAVAGLLVGVGTRLGSGCTSGHGVCGMSRLGPRSLVATASFIIAGIATVAVMNALGVDALGQDGPGADRNSQNLVVPVNQAIASRPVTPMEFAPTDMQAAQAGAGQ